MGMIFAFHINMNKFLEHDSLVIIVIHFFINN